MYHEHRWQAASMSRWLLKQLKTNVVAYQLLPTEEQLQCTKAALFFFCKLTEMDESNSQAKKPNHTKTHNSAAMSLNRKTMIKSWGTLPANSPHCPPITARWGSVSSNQSCICTHHVTCVIWLQLTRLQENSPKLLTYITHLEEQDFLFCLERLSFSRLL